MTKIFYSAYTNNDNVGDLLINKMQIEEYARYGEVYVDTCNMPETFTKILLDGNANIKDFYRVYRKSYRKNPYGVIKLLKKEGFTHFTKSPGPYAELKMPINTLAKRLIGWAGYAYAKHCGMKVIAIGVDVNFPERGFLGWLNRKYFSLYDRILLRSEQNEKRLRNTLSNVGFIPDMAFLYNTEISDDITERQRIALSFRETTHPKHLLKQLEDVARIAEQNRWDIDILHQVETDKAYAETLYEQLKSEHIHLKKELVWYKDLDIYKNYNFVISNRLHALLIGACYGAIPVALICENKKEEKIANIFHSSFSEKLLAHIDKDDISERLESIIENIQAENEQIKLNISAQQALCRQTIADTIYNQNV